MISPEANQISICRLKSNLKDIENGLVQQQAALPELVAANEEKGRETIKALRVARALNAAMEKLNHENVKLAAVRSQLKRQNDELDRSIEKVLKDRADNDDELRTEEQQVETAICKYEDLLHEKAKRFRSTSRFYNEVEMSVDFAKINSKTSELESLTSDGRRVVKGLQERLDDLKPAIPEDLLNLIGKNEVNEKLKTVTEKCAMLRQERNKLLE